MDERKKRSIILAVLLFVFGSIYGASLLWLAFDIIRDGPISWLDALALHIIFLGYGALYTLGDR